jgi:hypothetical protein
VCVRYIAYPNPDAITEGLDLDAEIEEEEVAMEARECFGDLLRWGAKIESDHHLVYDTRKCSFKFMRSSHSTRECFYVVINASC